LGKVAQNLLLNSKGKSKRIDINDNKDVNEPPDIALLSKVVTDMSAVINIFYEVALIVIILSHETIYS
jgi:hypothetical protein